MNYPEHSDSPWAAYEAETAAEARAMNEEAERHSLVERLSKIWRDAEKPRCGVHEHVDFSLADDGVIEADPSYQVWVAGKLYYETDDESAAYAALSDLVDQIKKSLSRRPA